MRLLAQQPRLSRSPFRSICTSGAEDDGVQFIADTLRAEQALKGNKGEERAISNALTALKKAKRVTSKDRKYLAA
jgi:hypothetical protein